MITAIREVRRAKGLTLEDVAARCNPPTTAQTIGRLETGTRTVSVNWLNRIAEALGVDASDLVNLPERPDIPVAAILNSDGVTAPKKAARIIPPAAQADLIAMTVSSGIGEYRPGDEIWLTRLKPEQFATALNCDVLVPRPAGRFLFGRMIGRDGEKLLLLPFGSGQRQQVISDPAWIGRAIRLIRQL